MSEPIFSILTGKLSLTQIDLGSYAWSGSGTQGDPYVTTNYVSFHNTYAIRGGSPGNWTSSNRPAWQVNGSGTFYYSITGMRSGDDDADHALYKSSDGGSTWTSAGTFVYPTNSLTIISFVVLDGDIIEQRGNGSFYPSDTYVLNPTIWMQ